MSAARSCLAAAVIATLVAAAPCRASAADEPLLLDVLINGQAIGKIGEFVVRDGVVLARRDELESLGIALPGLAPGPVPASTEAGGLVSLASVPGLAARLDGATQTIFITASDDRLAPTLLGRSGYGGETGAIESGTGATLDYDVFGTSAAHRAFADGLVDLRVFSPHGVASTGVIVRAGARGGVNASSVLRLDTTYTVSDVTRLRRYRFGDFITGALDWTRPIRLAGVQVVRDFGLRPDLVTFPVPSVSGSVAVPSTVDVLVNGTEQFGGEVPAGPFQLQNLPVVNGAGTVSTRITNALGNQVTTELPFYASVSLLAPGLQAYSAQVGAVRRYWGLRSNDYGQIAASGTYRRGLTSHLTIEGTGEATDGLVMGGAGLVLNVANLAVVNVAGAASSSRGALGGEVAAGIQHVGPVFTFGVSSILAGEQFRDIAATQGDAVPRRQLRANAGVAFRGFGTLGLAYAGLDRALNRKVIDSIASSHPRPVDPLSLAPAAFLPVAHARLVSGSYSAQWRLLSLQLTGYQDFARREARGLVFSATMPLGRRDGASVATTTGPRGSHVQAQANRTAMAIGDWGYQVAARSDAGGGFGQVDYRSGVAQFSVGVEQAAGHSTGRVGARGSVSLLGNGVFLSNTIPDSFAVVDTGVPGIGVMVENRPVGRTDAHGRLLVPDLRSFDANHLSIDPLDAPLEARVETVAKVVRPFDRSGVVVRFPLAPSRGALVRLVDAAGRPLPLGSAATLTATGEVVPVGYEGAAYLESLGETNDLMVERPDGTRCTVRFALRPGAGPMPTIGPLPCRDEGR